MRNVTILLAVVAVLVLAVPAYGAKYDWETDDGDWDVATNWSWDGEGVPTDYPLNSDYAAFYIRQGLTCRADHTVNYNCQFSYVGKSTGGKLVLEDGADFSVLSGMIWVGYQCGDAVSTITQEAGSTSSGGDFTLGYQSKGEYVISGGVMDLDDMTVGHSTAGTSVGLFKVVGTSPTSIDIDTYVQNSVSTLEVVLDSGTRNGNDHITKIVVNDDTTLGGYLCISGYTEKDKVVTIMTTTGNLTYTLSIVRPNGSTNTDWEFVSHTNGTPGSIQVKCLVPEPATMVLLGLGGLGVLIRRRRS